MSAYTIVYGSARLVAANDREILDDPNARIYQPSDRIPFHAVGETSHHAEYVCGPMCLADYGAVAGYRRPAPGTTFDVGDVVETLDIYDVGPSDVETCVCCGDLIGGET